MRKNFQGRKQMNPALANISREQHDRLLARASIKANLLMTMMVLSHTFEFTTEQLEEFYEAYKIQMDAYRCGNIESSTDFEQMLREDHGIEIEF